MVPLRPFTMFFNQLLMQYLLSDALMFALGSISGPLIIPSTCGTVQT